MSIALVVCGTFLYGLSHVPGLLHGPTWYIEPAGAVVLRTMGICLIAGGLAAFAMKVTGLI